MIVKAYPACPRCNRRLEPLTPWHNINLCRLLILLPYIETHPGLSTAELAHAVGLVYNDALKALQYARSNEIISADPEDRVQGGIRYRYSIAPGWDLHHPFATWELTRQKED
jgi:hypothetical protein